MNKSFGKLPVIPLNAGSSYSHPPTPPEIVHLDDAALDVMVDLKQANAFTIGPDAPIPEAAMEMRVCHTHILLVTNKEEYVVGLISSEDILGEKPLKINLERRIKRSDITVRMVMIPQTEIIAINIEELRHAKVSSVIQTLHEMHQHNALVVEVDALTGEQTVRGLFCLHQISKQLGRDVTFDMSEAHTLYELQHGMREKR